MGKNKSDEYCQKMAIKHARRRAWQIITNKQGHGRIIYVCDDCGQRLLTVKPRIGLAPFSMCCPLCGGSAKAGHNHDEQWNTSMYLDLAGVWVKPSAKDWKHYRVQAAKQIPEGSGIDIEDIIDAERTNVKNGGLIFLSMTEPVPALLPDLADKIPVS